MRSPAPLPVFDADRLILDTHGDLGLACDLLVLFQRQCEILLPLVADPGAVATRADGAHLLKGGAAAVSAARVAAAAGLLETLLTSGAPKTALDGATRDLVLAVGAFGDAAARWRAESAALAIPKSVA